MLKQNYSLKAYNTFGLEAEARYFFEYETEDELIGFLKKEEFKKIPLFILGRGSNLVFAKNFDGLVLHTKITGCEIVFEDKTEVQVRVGAGVEWDDFVAWAVENEYGGIENLSYIPGHVGAAPVQNIGAYGVEAKDVIDVVEAVKCETGEIYKFQNKDCQFGYRDSIFKNALKNKYIVTHVTFLLSKKNQYVLDYGNVRAHLEARGEEPNLKSIRETIIEIRKQKLPDFMKLGNAGSFFKNPVVDKDIYLSLNEKYPNMPHYEVGENVKIPAAWLIDQCGLKGAKEGGAQVHEQQPLVIINVDNASSEDIISLSNKVKNEVLERFGIGLEPEVNIIG